jgi:hypothetical protein
MDYKPYFVKLEDDTLISLKLIVTMTLAGDGKGYTLTLIGGEKREIAKWEGEKILADLEAASLLLN